MAPQTRSHGAPAPSHVYHSTPAQQQVHFPARRKVVRTYGKPRRGQNAAADRALRQQTLTQFDFVSSLDDKEPIVLGDSDSEAEDEEEEEEDKENRKAPGTHQDDDDDEPVPSGSKRRAVSKKPTAKRRRTLGDGAKKKEERNTKEDRQSRRKTTGDAPSPSYHTQTLTQFLGCRGYIRDSEDEDEDEVEVEDEDEVEVEVEDQIGDDGFQDWLQDAPPSPVKPKSEAGSRAESVIPQTPSKKTIRFEIPSSSQLTTPNSVMLGRYGSLGQIASQTPSKGKPPASVPMPELTGKPKSATPKLPKLAIHDTFSTESWSSREPTQTTRRPLREKTPEPQESASASEDAIDETPTKPRRRGEGSQLRASQKSHVTSQNSTRVGLEIPDSDEEDNFDQDENVEVYAAGPETQVALNELSSTEGRSGMTTPTPAPIIDEATKSSSVTSVKTVCRSSPAPVEPSSQPTTHRVPSSPPRPLAQPLRKPSRQASPHTAHTQPAESQRVPLATLQSFPPASVRTDILLPLPVDVLASVLGGYQVHVALPFKIPAQVVRFWLFDGTLLQYMACVEQTRPEDGQWHYGLGQVYELNNPMGDNDMREEEWYHGDIGRYRYLPPAIVSQLLWNLRHAIFRSGNEEEDDVQEEDDDVPTLPVSSSRAKDPAPSSSISISQQVEAQLQSDIAQCTNFPPSDEVIPLTPEAGSAAPAVSAHSPSIKPTPPGLTSYRASRAAVTVSEATHVVRPSQATTASATSTPERAGAAPASSCHAKPPARIPSSSLNFQECDSASPLHLPSGYTYPSSSQLLSKSQMLPDSLVRDDDRLPPEILDSDDDDG